MVEEKVDLPLSCRREAAAGRNQTEAFWILRLDVLKYSDHNEDKEFTLYYITLYCMLEACEPSVSSHVLLFRCFINLNLCHLVCLQLGQVNASYWLKPRPFLFPSWGVFSEKYSVTSTSF